MMQVTIKQKKEKNESVPFDKIPVGYVYVVEEEYGPTALKLIDGEAVLLNHSGNNDTWLAIADGFKGKPAHKILGKLTEIIVKEE